MNMAGMNLGTLGPLGDWLFCSGRDIYNEANPYWKMV